MGDDGWYNALKVRGGGTWPLFLLCSLRVLNIHSLSIKCISKIQQDDESDVSAIGSLRVSNVTWPGMLMLCIICMYSGERKCIVKNETKKQ